MFHKDLEIMTLKEIELKLRWFHGEDFNKYPLTEEHDLTLISKTIKQTK